MKRRDLHGSSPLLVVEPVGLPSDRMQAGVERLDGQARHIARDRNRRPRCSGLTPPRAVADDPCTVDHRFEDHAAGTERIGGRHRRPPRGGLAEVARGDGEDVRAGTQQSGQVDQVVVGPTWVGPHRASGHLGAVHDQHVPAVDPQPACSLGRCGIELDGAAEERNGVDRLGQDWAGGCGGHDGWPLMPDPSAAPACGERFGVDDAHARTLSPQPSSTAGSWLVCSGPVTQSGCKSSVLMRVHRGHSSWNA